MTQRLDYQNLSAAGVRAVGGVYMYLVNSGLPKELLDLVYLRASQINGCAYCIDSHARDLQKEGVPVEKIMLLQAWREAGAMFSARERAALQWTEEVTRVSETHASDEAFAAVSAEFQPKEVSDLTLGIGLINLFNRLAIPFRRPPDSVAAMEK
jgi:AhpD family alkylhydroperoxidase